MTADNSPLLAVLAACADALGAHGGEGDEELAAAVAELARNPAELARVLQGAGHGDDAPTVAKALPAVIPLAPDESARPALVARVLGDLLGGMGCPEGERPGAGEVAAWLATRTHLKASPRDTSGEHRDEHGRWATAGVKAALAEHAKAPEGHAKAALSAALYNAGAVDEDDRPVPAAKPSRKEVSGRLVSSWLELRRLGADAAPVERALDAAGVEKVGEAGETVPFDGTYHETADAVTHGAPVTVSRPGWVLRDGGGVLRLSPARVSQRGTVAKAFDPAEGRDEHGRWSAGEALAAVKEHGPEAAGLAKRLAKKARRVATWLATEAALRGLTPESVLWDVTDYGKIYLGVPGRGDWLSTHLGVSGGTAVAVGTALLSYAAAKVKAALGKAGKTVAKSLDGSMNTLEASAGGFLVPEAPVRRRKRRKRGRRNVASLCDRLLKSLDG